MWSGPVSEPCSRNAGRLFRTTRAREHKPEHSSKHNFEGNRAMFTKPYAIVGEIGFFSPNCVPSLGKSDDLPKTMCHLWGIGRFLQNYVPSWGKSGDFPKLCAIFLGKSIDLVKSMCEGTGVGWGGRQSPKAQVRPGALELGNTQTPHGDRQFRKAQIRRGALELGNTDPHGREAGSPRRLGGRLDLDICLRGAK